MTRYPTESDKLKKAIEIAQTIQRQMAKDEASKKAPPQKKVEPRQEPHLMRDAVNDMQKKLSVTVRNVTIDQDKIEMAKYMYNQVHEKKLPVKQSVIEKIIGVDRNQPQEILEARQWYETNESHPAIQDNQTKVVKPTPKGRQTSNSRTSKRDS